MGVIRRTCTRHVRQLVSTSGSRVTSAAAVTPTGPSRPLHQTFNSGAAGRRRHRAILLHRPVADIQIPGKTVVNTLIHSLSARSPTNLPTGRRQLISQPLWLSQCISLVCLIHHWPSFQVSAESQPPNNSRERHYLLIDNTRLSGGSSLLSHNNKKLSCRRETA